MKILLTLFLSFSLFNAVPFSSVPTPQSSAKTVVNTASSRTFTLFQPGKQEKTVQDSNGLPATITVEYIAPLTRVNSGEHIIRYNDINYSVSYKINVINNKITSAFDGYYTVLVYHVISARLSIPFSTQARFDLTVSLFVESTHSLVSTINGTNLIVNWL
jgi:hypothetical protein